MIEYNFADKNDMAFLMQTRLTMLKEVNSLPADYIFSDEFTENTRLFFETGNQSTVLATDDNKAVGCATICYTELMPTFSHQSGKRAHLMNVWTDFSYRHRNIAKAMVNMLIEQAKQKGVTEISLDATEMGRPLYEKLGFTASDECMTINLN